MFKRRKTREKKAVARPQIEESPTFALELPSPADFRTSLILPHLTQRFDLLREKDGSLVSYEKMSRALRVQRETGYLDSQEEEALLRQFMLQAAREQKTYLKVVESAKLDEPVTPTSLEEFHKFRKASNASSSLFGHTAGKDMDQASSKARPLGSRGNRSAPSTPSKTRNRSDTQDSYPSSGATSPSTNSIIEEGDPFSPFNTVEAGSPAEYGLASKLREHANGSPPIQSAPRLRPQKSLTAESIHRISRVLEDLEKNFTGKVSVLPDPFASINSRHTPNSTDEATEELEQIEQHQDVSSNVLLSAAPSLSPVPFLSSPLLPSSSRTSTSDVTVNPSDAVADRTPTLDNSSFLHSPGSFPESPAGSLEPPHDIISLHSETNVMNDASISHQIFARMFPSPHPDVEEHVIDKSSTAAPSVKGKAHATSASESTDVSTPPSGILSPNYQYLNRSSASLNSTGSSYCPDLGYESEDPLDQKQTTDPFEFDSFNGLNRDESIESFLDGQQTVVELLPTGLNIQDVAYIQSELVRTASMRQVTPSSLHQVSTSEATATFSRSSNDERPVEVLARQHSTGHSEASSLHSSVQSVQDAKTPSLMESLISPSVKSDSHPSFPPTPVDPHTPMSVSSQNTVNGVDCLQSNMSDNGESTPMIRKRAESLSHTKVFPTQEAGRSSPHHPSVAAQLRGQPTARSLPTANTDSVLIRNVAEQAAQATAALKDNQQDLKRRKSSKSFKTSAISAPHLVSSSAKLEGAKLVNVKQEVQDEPRNLKKSSSTHSLRQRMMKRFDSKTPLPVAADEIIPFNPAEFTQPARSPNGRDLGSPEMSAPSPATLYSTFSSPTSPEVSTRLDRSGSISSLADSSNSSLGKILSRFRKRKGSESLPNSPPLDRAFSPPALPMKDDSHLDSMQISPTLQGGSSTSAPSASRTPVTYNVASRRKRAGSSSAESSPAIPYPPSPVASIQRKPAPLIRGSWVPPDPEVSAASWRDSYATQSDTQPTEREEEEEAIRKLRDAAQTLGLDAEKINQLVDSRANSALVTDLPKIEEESVLAGQAPSPMRRMSSVADSMPIPRASLQRSLTLMETTVTKPPTHPRTRRGSENNFALSDSVSSLRSTRERVHTPPPSTRHRRFSSRDLRSPPLPTSPLKLSHSSASSHDKDIADPTSSSLISQEPLQEHPSDKISEPLAQDDGSLVWQMVRDLRRNSALSMASSEFGGLAGFHSRNSSQDSSNMPSSSFTRPLISAEKLKLVVSQNKHRRMLSSEKGVGNLGYIRSPTLVTPSFDDVEETDLEIRPRPSVSSDGQSTRTFEAEDNVVSALIEDLTSAMDSGSFNLVRQNSINKIKMASKERSAVRGLQIKKSPRL